MSSVIVAGNVSGSVTLDAPAVSGSTVITLPTTSGTMMVNGPAFSAYAGAQSVTSGVTTKVQLANEEFDTNSNFDSVTNYRFTPTVAGYYQINGAVYPSTATTSASIEIYKNGARYKFVFNSGTNISATVSCVLFLNGSTDYVELYASLVGVTPAFQSGYQYTTFSGALVRGA